MIWSCRLKGVLTLLSSLTQSECSCSFMSPKKYSLMIREEKERRETGGGDE